MSSGINLNRIYVANVYLFSALLGSVSMTRKLQHGYRARSATMKQCCGATIPLLARRVPAEDSPGHTSLPLLQGGSTIEHIRGRQGSYSERQSLGKMVCRILPVPVQHPMSMLRSSVDLKARVRS